MPPFWDFERVDRPELMDTRSFPPAMVRDTLRFLSLANRRFGGEAVVLRRLEEWSRRWTPGETVTLLDVGTGGGDIALAAARWARSRGLRLRVTAADLVPEIAAVARENARDFPEIEVIAGDALHPATVGGRWDYVAASLFLHHIPPCENASTLAALDGLSRRGTIVSDLQRSIPAFLAVTALGWLAGNAVVRHDGPLSVRRAFTLQELADLARAAGLPHLSARAEPWFRLSLSGEKT